MKQERGGIKLWQADRILWNDSCCGIGTILVVLGHCHSPFNKFTYRFHMPLFFN